jgi:hypothetical protein
MSIQISIIQEPLYGKVSWNGSSFVYVPNAGYSGKDSYTYIRTEGSESKILTNYTNTENNAPTASNISLTANASELINIDVTDYISDDGLVSPLEVIKVSPTFFGVTSIVGPVIKYRSNGYSALEHFTYTISDGQYVSTARISINIINGVQQIVSDAVIESLDTIQAGMTIVSQNSAGWNQSYTLLNSKSAVWNAIDTPRFDSAATTVQTNSSSWNEVASAKAAYDETVTIVNSNSADWILTKSNIDNVVSTFSANSAAWDLVESILQTNSATWNSSSQAFSSFEITYIASTGHWEDTYNLVYTNSASWDNTAITNVIYSNSANWDSSYATLCSVSAEWELYVSQFSAFETDYITHSANWENVYNLVYTNSASWDKTNLINIISSNSANWDSSYSILCSNSAIWDNAVQGLNVLYTDFNLNSANWQNVYLTVSANSAIWDKTELTSVISSNSANWDSAYSTLCSNSAFWESNVQDVTNLETTYRTSSGSWEATYVLVSTNSASWDTTSLANTVQTHSGMWDDTWFAVSTTSASWDNDAVDILNLTNSYSANSAIWQDTFNTVQTSSAGWGGVDALTILSSNSAAWDAASNLVQSQSAYWTSLSSEYAKYDGAYSILSSSSANWDTTYNTVSLLSANWENTLSIISANSAEWLHGSQNLDFTANDLYVYGNTIIYGNLTARGSITQQNSDTVSTSSFSITNIGFDDALTVTKTQSTGAIAAFKSDGNTVLYISTLSTVGINTTSPNEALTVVGNISTTGTIYAKVPDEYNVFSANSGKYENSFAFFAANSATVNSLLSSKPLYDAAYTYINVISGDIETYQHSISTYEDTITLYKTQSSISNDNYTFLNSNSAYIGTDSLFRSNSAKYDTGLSLLGGITAQNCQINYIFDGGGVELMPVMYGYVQIPSDIKILNWNILADTATTATMQILCSDYNSFGDSSIDISGYGTSVNALSIINTSKACSSTLVGWLTSISVDSILTFKLISNDNANVITLSLKCIKY